MAATSPHVGEGAPQRIRWRKRFSHHESEPSVVAFSTGDLWCKGEELLVNEALSKKAT
jgi:hypothetical protein